MWTESPAPSLMAPREGLLFRANGFLYYRATHLVGETPAGAFRGQLGGQSQPTQDVPQSSPTNSKALQGDSTRTPSQILRQDVNRPAARATGKCPNLYGICSSHGPHAQALPPLKIAQGSYALTSPDHRPKRVFQ